MDIKERIRELLDESKNLSSNLEMFLNTPSYLTDRKWIVALDTNSRFRLLDRESNSANTVIGNLTKKEMLDLLPKLSHFTYMVPLKAKKNGKEVTLKGPADILKVPQKE